jgi:ComF family protein
MTVCDYDGPAVDLILRFKQADHDWMARPLAALMVQTWAQQCPPPIDIVVPVPTTTARFLHRGFNPAYQLGRHVAKAIARPIHGNWVFKLTETPAQHLLARQQRLTNLKGGFAVLPRARDSLSGKHLLLIDDIMTTGATLAELGRVLNLAGASSISILVFARTAAAATIAHEPETGLSQRGAGPP